jgi:hypothetical protein
VKLREHQKNLKQIANDSLKGTEYFMSDLVIFFLLFGEKLISKPLNKINQHFKVDTFGPFSF